MKIKYVYHIGREQVYYCVLFTKMNSPTLKKKILKVQRKTVTLKDLSLLLGQISSL